MEPLSILLTGLKSWAPTVISALLIPLVIWLINQIQQNARDDGVRSDALKTYVSDLLNSLKKDFAEQIKILKDDIEKKQDNLDRRISCLELDCVKKDEYYRENSGWRSEIGRLSDQITKTLTEFPKMVIELWKEINK